MKTISFTIHGNHKDEFGNPVPKLKMTGRQHWTPEAKSYQAWKEYVVAVMLKQQSDRHLKRVYAHNFGILKKPIVLSKDQHAHMSLTIQWKGFTHGDPENIFGSIADALFHNDKHLDVEVKSFYCGKKPSKGQVDAVITIFDSEAEKLKWYAKR